MRLSLLLVVSLLWAGTSAFSLGKPKPSPGEQKDDKPALLRRRKLTSFLDRLDYGIVDARGGKGGDAAASSGKGSDSGASSAAGKGSKGNNGKCASKST